MINWSEGFGGFYSKVIDWIGGFGILNQTEPRPVLRGTLVSFEKTGVLTRNEISGFVSISALDGEITNRISGSIICTELTGTLNIKT